MNETTKLMGMGISYSVHRNCKGNLASDKNKRLLLLSLFILPLVEKNLGSAVTNRIGIE